MSHVIAKSSSLLIILISFRYVSVFTLRVLFVVCEQLLLLSLLSSFLLSLLLLLLLLSSSSLLLLSLYLTLRLKAKLKVAIKRNN